MFWIDYTLPRSSRYMLFLDMPFRYSWRHLLAYFTSRIIHKKTGLEYLTANERTAHFIIAFFEVLPVLGMAVAIIDRMIFAKNLSPVATYSEEHKKLARFMIKNLVPVYAKIYGKEFHTPYFLPRFDAEMKALANQLEVSYKEMALANCIFDRLALFGSAKNSQETICSLKYDGKKKKLYYAFSSDHAAGRSHKCYKLVSSGYQGTLEHNIAVPMSLLAPFMRLFVHEHFVSIGLLGLVGCYGGINSHGLFIAASSIVVASKEGMPNQLLYRQILEEATSVKEAKCMLDKSHPSSSMKLILADAAEKICYDLNR